MTETAIKTAEELRKEIYDLQKELRELPEKLNDAKLRGDSRAFQDLKTREEFLPSQIKRAEIAALESEASELDRRETEAKRKAEELAPLRREAEERLNEAQKKMQEARAAHMGQVRQMETERTGAALKRQEINRLKKQLEVL